MFLNEKNVKGDMNAGLKQKKNWNRREVLSVQSRAILKIKKQQ